MNAHPIDFEINQNVFSTPEVTAIFDERTRYQRWLDFEASLAKVQAELEIIPAEAAIEICNKAKLEHIDLEEVRRGYQKSRNSIVPLLNGLKAACDHGYGEYVHYGATTQDVIDTSEILEIRDTLSIVYRDLRDLEAKCLELAIRHKSTPIAARTHGQQALPTTFGMKVAVWLSEIRRHIERVKHLNTVLCIGQLSGAVGTMAALGPKAFEVVERTLKDLGLKHSPLAWHTSRDSIGELSAVFSLVVTTCTKIANEIFQLQKIEISELREPSANAASSSTMPHKQNPVICQRIVALSRHVRHLSGTIMESLPHEHERDARCLWAEWLAVPQLCIYTGTALNYTLNVISGLNVLEENMLKNLYIQKHFIVSEWLLFRLSHAMGKMAAMDKLRLLSKEARDGGKSLKDAVTTDPELKNLLGEDEISMLDHPERYIGQAVRIVEETVENIRQQRMIDPEEVK
ncbi:MAG: adenylosuccinate lyase family protein [Desulfobulbaceae bacterium]|nr:adenylosuccinate lyase family protein [Desulfobulbaceae bacterium]